MKLKKMKNYDRYLQNLQLQSQICKNSIQNEIKLQLNSNRLSYREKSHKTQTQFHGRVYFLHLCSKQKPPAPVFEVHE